MAAGEQKKRTRHNGAKRPKRNRTALRKAQLKWKFGITLEEYNQLLEKQNNCCAGCGRHENEFTSKLCVDHCHQTNIIRGLLCHGCNKALGDVKDNTETLRGLILYLQKERKPADADFLVVKSRKLLC